ncbi:hypothetical protein ABL57_02605 [Kocuria sp. SM24M-10]|nr:hypothetical protein ABL57_02605 [Kocuria sp. SM24M-10]
MFTHEAEVLTPVGFVFLTVVGQRLAEDGQRECEKRDEDVLKCDVEALDGFCAMSPWRRSCPRRLPLPMF